MSQHDFDIANQSASNARADINSALKALASLSSGATAPATTYANMPWYETDTNTLKIRAEADDAWISMGYLDQSTDTFALFDDTKVVNSGGTQTGLLGDQTEAVWEAGTGATESLVSPAKIKAAIEGLAVKKYDSGYFSFANTTVYNLTHGLGGEPDSITVKAKCKDATGDYSVGDVVLVAASASDPDGDNEGHVFYMTSTTLSMATGDNGAGHVTSKTGGGGFSVIKPSKWDLRVQAFRFP